MHSVEDNGLPDKRDTPHDGTQAQSESCNLTFRFFGDVDNAFITGKSCLLGDAFPFPPKRYLTSAVSRISKAS